MKGPRTCRSCGADRETAPQRRWACQGYCGTCYRRWANQGFPHGGPSARPGAKPGGDRISQRIRVYERLSRAGLSTAEICREMHVTRRTVTRYRQLAQAGEVYAAGPTVASSQAFGEHGMGTDSIGVSVD